MNHIALHILQSFPATCLNRDDVGAPKNLIFGGATRARVSSQCWKRVTRELARELNQSLFAGQRTRRAAEDLARELMTLGVAEAEAQTTALTVCHAFLSDKEPKKAGKAKGKAKSNAKNANESESEAFEETEEVDQQTSTLLYFSPGEIKAMAEAIVQAQKDSKPVQNAASAAVKNYTRKDAADISIFGRMVANDTTLTIEGAGMFSHAFSTHACDNDLDFWTAVDDGKTNEQGAANMGHAEFNSACYYRYVALNLDMLADSDHLKAIGQEGRKDVVRTFLRAILLSVPSARQNGMSGPSLPSFAMGVVSTGQPFLLANAFEKPIRSTGQGWTEPSVTALNGKYDEIKAIFGLEKAIREEVRLSRETPLDTFIEKLVAHVH